MQLLLAGNYKVGSEMNQSAFAAEFQYGMRAGQGCPMKNPVTGQAVTSRDNAAFQAGKTWGEANASCRDIKAVEVALNAAWRAY